MKDELLKRFPSGLILGKAVAIVGDLGLTTKKEFESGTDMKRFEPNEEVSIIEIKGDYLELGGMKATHAIVPIGLFKGFKIYKHEL